jgi:hypothetical protein
MGSMISWVWPTAPNDPPVGAQSDTSDETPDVADEENYAELKTLS